MKLIRVLAVTLFMLFSSLAYADIGSILHVQKDLTIYADPTPSAKVLSTLKAGQQLIPVFQQNDWVKVANPANGDIGWVKSQDLQQTIPALSQQAVMQSYIITQQGKDGQKVFQVDAQGNVQPLKGEQAQTVIKQMDLQQQQMQEQMNKMMTSAWQNFLTTQDLFNKLNQQYDWHVSGDVPSTPATAINKTSIQQNQSK